MAVPGGSGGGQSTPGNMKFNNVQATMPGAALVAKLKGPLIAAIESDAAFRNAIVAAILPAVRAQAAATASQTAGGKGGAKKP